MNRLRVLMHSPAHRVMLKVRFERFLQDFVNGWHKSARGRIIFYTLAALTLLSFAYMLAMAFYLG